jgi:hypothetical protein
MSTAKAATDDQRSRIHYENRNGTEIPCDPANRRSVDDETPDTVSKDWADAQIPLANRCYVCKRCISEKLPTLPLRPAPVDRNPAVLGRGCTAWNHSSQLKSSRIEGSHAKCMHFSCLMISLNPSMNAGSPIAGSINPLLDPTISTTARFVSALLRYMEQNKPDKMVTNQGNRFDLNVPEQTLHRYCGNWNATVVCRSKCNRDLPLMQRNRSYLDDSNRTSFLERS